MKRIATLAALLAAGCATAPQQPAPQTQVPAPQTPHVRNDLLGMTASDLVQLFGRPDFQVREGVGLKLQFRGRSCVLDAYLYPPPAGGPERVSHVDTRLPSGAGTEAQGCVRSLRQS